MVLTCDRHFVRARYSDHTYFVRSERKGEQLDEVRTFCSYNIVMGIFGTLLRLCAPQEEGEQIDEVRNFCGSGVCDLKGQAPKNERVVVPAGQRRRLLIVRLIVIAGA